jgi:hypothetical protein
MCDQVHHSFHQASLQVERIVFTREPLCFPLDQVSIPLLPFLSCTYLHVCICMYAGLSYTTFQYGVAHGPTRVSLAPVHKYLSAHPNHGGVYASLKDNTEVTAYSVNVTNTGNYDADDVVIGFLIPPGAGSNGVPIQQVFGFQRVFVPVNATVQVWLGLTARDFTQVTPEGVRVVSAGIYTLRFGVQSGHHVETTLETF